MSTFDEEEDDDRSLDDGQDGEPRCFDDGCEDDGLGRCMICDRRLPEASSYMAIRVRRSAKQKLARTRARAKERRAIMRGRRNALKGAARLRRRGERVQRDADIVQTHDVIYLREKLHINFRIGEYLFFFGFPDVRVTNERGCLHCDGSGCRVDRRDCDHVLF